MERCVPDHSQEWTCGSWKHCGSLSVWTKTIMCNKKNIHSKLSPSVCLLRSIKRRRHCSWVGFFFLRCIKHRVMYYRYTITTDDAVTTETTAWQVANSLNRIVGRSLFTRSMIHNYFSRKRLNGRINVYKSKFTLSRTPLYCTDQNTLDTRQMSDLDRGADGIVKPNREKKNVQRI